MLRCFDAGGNAGVAGAAVVVAARPVRPFKVLVRTTQGKVTAREPPSSCWMTDRTTLLIDKT